MTGIRRRCAVGAVGLIARADCVSVPSLSKGEKKMKNTKLAYDMIFIVYLLAMAVYFVAVIRGMMV